MLSSSGWTARLRTAFGALAERRRRTADDLAGGSDHDGLGQPLPVGGAAQRGVGRFEVLGGLDVGGDVPHAQHLRDVPELREAGLHAVAAAAGGAISISVTVWPNVAAQVSKSVMPASASRSGRR